MQTGRQDEMEIKATSALYHPSLTTSLYISPLQHPLLNIYKDNMAFYGKIDTALLSIAELQNVIGRIDRTS